MARLQLNFGSCILAAAVRVTASDHAADHFTRFGPGVYGFNWWFNETGRDHPDRPNWPA
jgi:hypothetical protein